MTHVDETTLMMYLDGELAPEIADDVRRALADSPELRDMERELRDLLGDVTLAFSAAPDVEGYVLPLEGGTAPPHSISTRESAPLSLVEFREKRKATASSQGRFKWSSRGVQALAATALIAAGLSGGWFMAAGARSSSNSIPGIAEQAERGKATPNMRVAHKDPTEGGRLRERVTEGAPAQPSESPLSTAASRGFRYEFRVPGASIVASSERANGTEGEKTLEVNGVRIEMSYGAKLSGEGQFLTRTEVAQLAQVSTVDTSSTSVSADVRALARQGTRGAPAGNTVRPCASALRLRDDVSGVTLELRGPLSCSDLARLAQRIEVNRVPFQ